MLCIERPLPGFQIAPEVPTEVALAELQIAMQRIDPKFSFNDISGMRNPDMEARPHFDAFCAQRLAGIAMHQ